MQRANLRQSWKKKERIKGTKGFHDKIKLKALREGVTNTGINTTQTR